MTFPAQSSAFYSGGAAVLGDALIDAPMPTAPEPMPDSVRLLLSDILAELRALRSDLTARETLHEYNRWYRRLSRWFVRTFYRHPAGP